MKLIKRYTAPLVVLVTLGFLIGCAAALKPAITLDSGFQPQKVDKITMLPAVDARFDRKLKVNLQRQLNNKAKHLLESRGYEVQVIDTGSSESQITKDDLKSADEEWIKQLGPADANWVMVLALDDVVNKLTFGSTGNAEVSGYLFDKHSGLLVWHDKGIGQCGQGGLIGMPFKSLMDNKAISQSVNSLIASIPVQPKKTKSSAGDSL